MELFRIKSNIDEIANKKNFKLIDHLDRINDLLKSKYIKKIKDF